MKSEIVSQLKNQFDILAQKATEEDVEFCFAKDIQVPLGYAKRNQI
jgi:DNA-damage-inducible protein D